MANSLTAFYSIFRVAALPTTYWTRDLQALQQLLFRWYGFMMQWDHPTGASPDTIRKDLDKVTMAVGGIVLASDPTNNLQTSSRYGFL